MSNYKTASLVLIEPLGELDIRAVRIGQERVGDSSARNLAIPDVKLDAVRLRFGAEGFKVFNFKSDMIHSPSLSSRRLWRIAKGIQTQIGSWDVRGHMGRPLGCVKIEGLDIPC